VSPVPSHIADNLLRSALQLGYRDKAWSVNRLGAVARRHGYGEACLRIINSLYGFNAMEVQEAFIKIREQVRRDTLYKPLSRQRGRCTPDTSALLSRRQHSTSQVSASATAFICQRPACCDWQRQSSLDRHTLANLTMCLAPRRPRRTWRSRGSS
jgi:hypothetical protein